MKKGIMRLIHFILLFIFVGLVFSESVEANPTQFGDSGLLSQPTAETLNSGNICIGILANCSDSDNGSSTIIPVGITLGLGSFWEAYGSYPNILFNDDEMDSGRGFANVGFKLRVIGSRSSLFKLALDGQIRKTISDNKNFDGLTDKVGRLIFGLKSNTIGVHGNVGYIQPDSPEYLAYDNQLIYGGGVEYFPKPRLRLLTEVGIESAKRKGLADQVELTAGVQYFLSPHMTLGLSLGRGFSDISPDWRALIGFSSCQGVGTYQRPIPRLVQQQSEKLSDQKIESKVKIKTLTPLIPKVKSAEAPASASKFEVPVGDIAEEVVVSPTPAVSLGALPSAVIESTLVMEGGAGAVSALTVSAGVPLLQVASQLSATSAATAMSMPIGAVGLSALKKGRIFKVDERVLTDDGKNVGKKLIDDPRYSAEFVSIVETSKQFVMKFFHKYDKALDVWIETSGKIKHELSSSKVAPFEEVTLTIDKISGKVPYFKLHLGEHSEVFEFYPESKNIKIGNITIQVAPAGDFDNNGATAVLGGVSAPIAATAVSGAGAGAAPAAGAMVVGSAAVQPMAGASVIGAGSAAAPSAGAAVADKRVAAAPSAGALAASQTEAVAATEGAGAGAAVVPTAPVAGKAGVSGTGSTKAPIAGVSVAGPSGAAAPVAGRLAAPQETSPVPSAGASSRSSSQGSAPVAGATAVLGGVSAPIAATAVSGAGAGAAPAAGAMVVGSAAVQPMAGASVIGAGSAAAPSAGALAASQTEAAAPTEGPSAGAAVVPTAPVAGKAGVSGTIVGERKTITAPIKAVVYRKFRLPSTVTFAFDDATLTEEGKIAITDVVEAIRTEKRWFVIRVDGFTDNVGSDEYNLKLGLQRAISVASFMVTNNGIDPKILFVKSAGEENPIATNETDEGRSLNRRAEILLFVPKDEQ